MLTIAIIFFFIAIIYSTVGFGGGSSYIAVLILMGVSVSDTRLTALICNIIVVLGSIYRYHKAQQIEWKNILSILIFSVPMAFIGGRITIDDDIYKTIAAVSLIMASLLMFFSPEITSKKEIKMETTKLSFLGGSIGFISGLIGIGGGIFLSPFLHIIKWADPIKISAAASLFILVNSISGLLGQLTLYTSVDYQLVGILGIAVFLGGMIGNHLSLKILKPSNVKLLTAFLVGFVGLRILYIQLM